ncbi:MAG: tRNA 2-selenouridine(34) synthase MnmH [Pseudomonadota bacterium]
MELPVVDDYRRLFLEEIPLLDVRAPVEFAAGAFPHTENLPLINDAERHEIGIRYKELGQDAALDLGHELVQGATRAARITAWQQFAGEHPDGVLYCFRGGQRSRISQQWLYEATGIAYPRVKGGYKALRRFLIDELERAATRINAVALGGRTGVGKTLLLKTLPRVLDLEGLAWHRGSAFGRHATPQPTQVDFENRLAVVLMKLQADADTPLVVEDEGRAVGSVHLPVALHDALKGMPLVVLEASLEERVANTHREYITEALAEYRAIHGEARGFEHWAAYLLDSLERIRRRLGGARHREIRNIMESALSAHRDNADTIGHRAWIERLLAEYYDPMYDYQIARGSSRVIFTGGRGAVYELLAGKTTVLSKAG